MSLVFAAENTVTNKQVALKFLLASVAGRPDARTRLLREARASARIKHRNVVDVYDVGFEGETMFLVMDLLEGETLATVLETTTMSIRALLQLLIPAMRGVAEAHRQGVIHRDLKPDNIFLAREIDHSKPVVTVLDFGIAKLEGDSLRTHSGHATGTPVFMSVEQIRGARDLDARVDVYGFGVILYVALAGRLPVIAETLPELIYKLMSSSVVPLSALRPELPSSLCEIVARAMAREREDRTPSLAHLISELTPFAHGSDELGSTWPLRYGPDVERMPATKPACGLRDIGGDGPHAEEAEPPAREREALRASSVQSPPSSWRRRRFVLVIAASLAMAGAVVLVARDSPPRSKPLGPRALAEAPVEPESIANFAREEPETVTSAPALAASPIEQDAGGAALSPAARRTPRARKVATHPAAVEPIAPAPLAPTRRRLASEDFFGTTQP